MSRVGSRKKWDRKKDVCSIFLHLLWEAGPHWPKGDNIKLFRKDKITIQDIFMENSLVLVVLTKICDVS